MPSIEEHVRDAIREAGPLEAFHRLIAENDALIRRPELGNGRMIASARSAIYTGLLQKWAGEQQRAFSYNKPFAVVALGGTGRAEMSPCSDNDFAFLFDEPVEGNSFLLELQRQTLHSNEFEDRHGFAYNALPFSLDDVPNLSGKSLNAFLDMRAVHDPQGLSDQFRERIRATFDPFEHFLHVRSFWKGQWERATHESERLDRFDIKNEGLRLFLAGIWTLAGKNFLHSHEVYRTLEDPRDLAAYEFLLRIRAFVHLGRSGQKRPPAGGNHPEDVLEFDDFLAFGEMLGTDASERDRFEFANQVRARLLAARRRVALFAKSVIERELKRGREVGPGNPIVYGSGGLYHPTSGACRTPHERSRAALSLLLASQHYGVPIDPSELQATFLNAGDWLVRVPELSGIFYDQRGSVADTFDFLSQVDAVEERLFPGYGKFESSLDGRVMTERKSLRGAMERQKIRMLEQYVCEGRAMTVPAGAEVHLFDSPSKKMIAIEAAHLDADQLAAIKLALKTKRLPLTEHDLTARLDESRPLYERWSSGFSEIPLSKYYEPYITECDFSRETVGLAEFLVANHRAFKERAAEGLNDARQVEEFVRHCQSEHRLRTLFVFTCADRAEWESEQTDPVRWFNTRELYAKAMMRFQPRMDPSRALTAAGWSSNELNILRDFGEDFFGGVYRHYANRFGEQLVRLVENPDSTGPKANILREGASVVLGVAARDYRGLAATISGMLWHRKVEVRQAHLFSAMHHGLAFDFFHIAPGEAPLPPDLATAVEEAIQGRLHIHEQDEPRLPQVTGNASLREWRPGQFCLRFVTTMDAKGLIYALTYKVFRALRGNIFGLTAHSARGHAYVSVYLNLPADVSFEQARLIVEQQF